MATYAIGDIQGCFSSLQNLLECCAFNPLNDRLWLTGDLVNRGPRSLETLRFIKSLGASAISVLGNHDLSLLIIAAGFRPAAKGDTFGDILAAPDCDELLAWLRQCPLCHYEAPYFLVHAGLLPLWDIAQARKLAAEIEIELRGENWRDFLSDLWGNTPHSWKDSHPPRKRWRVIVNAMTRMRFCTAKGRMEFKSKGEIADAPVGYMPWFDVPERRSKESVLITGHWSTLGLRVEKNLLSLDTGCLWGGKLTAVRLEDRRIFQVSCAQGEALSLLED